MPYFSQEEVIKTGAYLRLSVEDEKQGESNSITNQRSLTTDFASAKGLTLVDEYVDDGFSGTNFNRPGLKALLEDCRNHKINCVIVKDLSRLGRDMTQVGRLINETFPQMGIRFIAILDDYDSNDNIFVGLDMVTPFKNLCNEVYAWDISKKIRASIAVAQQEGKWLGGTPAYGYMKDPEDKHHLLVDEVAAKVIRQIYDLKIAGMNSKAIAQYLNMADVETPLQRMRRLGYKSGDSDEVIDASTWQPGIITNILQNETYLGTVVSRKRARPSYKIHTLKRNDKEAWLRVEGKHEPIISKETFDYVQDLFGRITLTTSKGMVRPLSGFVRCGDCGMVMAYRGPTDIEHQYVNCSSYLRKEGCSSHSMAVKKLHGLVLGAMRTHIEKLLEARGVLKEEEIHSFRQATIDGIEARINAELAEEKRLTALKTTNYEQKVNGLIGEQDYASMDLYVTDTLKATEAKIRELQEEKARVCAEQTSLIPWIDSLIEFRGLTELSRKAVVTMIDYVYIYKDKTVDVHFRYEEETKDLFLTAQGRSRKVG